MARLSLALVLLVLWQSAAACGSVPVREHKVAVERDLHRQAELVAELSSEADVVMVATVVATSDNAARVQAVEYLKGSGPAEREVQPTTYLHAVGCLASAAFRNVELQHGKRYVFYLSKDRVLRAGGFERSTETIAAPEELELVRESLRT